MISLNAKRNSDFCEEHFFLIWLHIMGYCCTTACCLLKHFKTILLRKSGRKLCTSVIRKTQLYEHCLSMLKNFSRFSYDSFSFWRNGKCKQKRICNYMVDETKMNWWKNWVMKLYRNGVKFLLMVCIAWSSSNVLYCKHLKLKD